MTSIDEHFDLAKYDNEIYSTSENVRTYILNIVDKLPLRNALVVILFYVDGLSLNEISQGYGNIISEHKSFIAQIEKHIKGFADKA